MTNELNELERRYEEKYREIVAVIAAGHLGLKEDMAEKEPTESSPIGATASASSVNQRRR